MMKKLYVSVLLLVVSLPSALVLNAQVGINTTVPYTKGVFHIDSKGNNTSATTVTAALAADDIVVDTKGNVGVGTVAPTTKLHIIATQGTIKPIRIADGSEGANKYLFSDDEGRVTWKHKPMPQGIVYYTKTQRTFTKGVFSKAFVEVNSAGNTGIRIPYEGAYIVTVRWFGSVSIDNTTTTGEYQVVSGDLELRRIRNGATSVIDKTVIHTSVQESGRSSSRMTFTMSLFAPSLQANDILEVHVKPTSGTDWTVGYGLAADQVDQVIYYPSIMVYNI